MKKILLVCLFFMTFLNVKSQDTLSVDEKFLSLKPIGYVNDFQNLFTSEQKDTLEQMMSDYEKKTSIEFAIVTYYIDNMYYNTELIRELAEKWGIGKEGINNGFLMFLSYSTEKGKSNYECLTGYGLEAFLPDAKLNRLNYDILLKYLLEGQIYEGYKQYILACQEVLGQDDYDMLVENKRIADEKRAAANKKAMSWFLNITLLLALLFGIGYVIYLIYQKRKKYLQLKREISLRLKSINELKSGFDNVPSTLEIVYNRLDVKTEDKLTKKYVNYEYLDSINTVYSLFLDYKATINSVERSLNSISNSKSEIKRYLLNKYPFCEKQIKDELNNILIDTNINKTNEYSKQRMNYLIGVESSLDRKLKSFTSKISKINAIITDNKNINNKVVELDKLHSEYIRKKNILLGSKIGNRIFTNIDYDENIRNIKTNITKSSDFLINDNLDSALSYYGNYFTTIAILTNSFNVVDSLFNQFNKSNNYIKLNEPKFDKLIQDIDGKINKSGVSYSRKSSYEEIKANIALYKKELNHDLIKASESLEHIITSLTILLSSIKSDITKHNNKSSSSYNSGSYHGGSYHSSSSSSSFGGFGGGSFGGGGAGGRF